MIILNKAIRIKRLNETIESFKQDAEISPELIKRYQDELEELKTYKSYFKINQNERRL